jgi:hypothetical protein
MKKRPTTIQELIEEARVAENTAKESGIGINQGSISTGSKLDKLSTAFDALLCKVNNLQLDWVRVTCQYGGTHLLCFCS